MKKTKCILIDQELYDTELDEQYKTGRYVGVGDAIDYITNDEMYLDHIDEEKVTDSQITRIDRIRLAMGRKTSNALASERDRDDDENRQIDDEVEKIVERANAHVRKTFEGEVVQ